MTIALTRSTDPLVWIDCEMTGLNPQTDIILSISCIITTPTLIPLDTGYHAILSVPQSTLSSMNEWCITTHTASGLVSSCLSSTLTAPVAASQLLSYIKSHIPTPGTGLLAGNSVHVDKLFLLKEPWNEVVEYLHYRILDVSAIKEGVRRWCDDSVLEGAPVKKGAHTAEEDVRESIEEARYYMGLFGRLGDTAAGEGKGKGTGRDGT